uniref:Uncharacterized protein n=1 Tax=Palpitomonas bilix TaxID=652834 RepID=A0A7S3GA09_9EUKA|mmetsp:Transcript_38816/g.99631  ORF Transcript_38816/g.99631 Transcript_38816/m.99631 type:complete len:141 (+) Transcript_38816:80-502(+)
MGKNFKDSEEKKEPQKQSSIGPVKKTRLAKETSKLKTSLLLTRWEEPKKTTRPKGSATGSAKSDNQKQPRKAIPLKKNEEETPSAQSKQANQPTVAEVYYAMMTRPRGEGKRKLKPTGYIVESDSESEIADTDYCDEQKE